VDTFNLIAVFCDTSNRVNNTIMCCALFLTTRAQSNLDQIGEYLSENRLGLSVFYFVSVSATLPLTGVLAGSVISNLLLVFMEHTRLNGPTVSLEHTVLLL